MQGPRTQASFPSAAIKIACEEVKDHSDEDEDAIMIALMKVEEQFNPVKEFRNLFPKPYVLYYTIENCESPHWSQAGIIMVTYLDTVVSQVWLTYQWQT